MVYRRDPAGGPGANKSLFKTLSRKGLERIKNVWGAQRVWDGTAIQHWLQHPLVQERINIKISGTPHVNRMMQCV